jgi:hypothetical protein
VGTVQLHAVEAQLAGRSGCLAESENNLLDLPDSHRLAGPLAGVANTGGP